MEIISNIKDLLKIRKDLDPDLKIGFVPTMGALHLGHSSLVKKAEQECDFCICSIFVNPKQFNSVEDLEKYPTRLDQDLKLLKSTGCHLVFLPSKDEIYPKDYKEKNYDFGLLDRVMEGVERPGHFNGVAMVVSRLFDLVKPQRAYFGEKDFQQLSIIKSLVAQEKRMIDIVACPILREDDGLAMSSRNLRLTHEMRNAAPRIYERLKILRKNLSHNSVHEQKKWMAEQFAHDPLLKLEYFEISNAQTLKPSIDWSESKEHIACIAVYAGSIRLIDNILLKIN